MTRAWLSRVAQLVKTAKKPTPVRAGASTVKRSMGPLHCLQPACQREDRAQARPSSPLTERLTQVTGSRQACVRQCAR